ncbi:hypothetical protein FJY71_01050 [candidate division WOR-3 bacterium]|nr:hypothetical protein [candidate division WOR-3 bacterium]
MAFQAEPELPRYRKRTRRAVAVVRCGGFHHELLLNVFHYRFCPECGVSLCRPHAGPEPA